MDNHTLPRSAVIRSGVVLLLVFALLRWAGTIDLLSNVTKPLVTGLLRLFDVTATDAGTYFTVGQLRVPWTGDCAGVNILALLVMLSLWVNRRDPLGLKHLRMLAFSLPLAFAANLARILTLIGYRAMFYPAVESAQLHYLIGFLWVLPVLPILLRGAGKWHWIEVLHLAVVLAMLTPMVGAPGGTLVAACALIVLANVKVRPAVPFWWMTMWSLAGLPIALSNMESLWLPWIISCPALIDAPRRWKLLLRCGLLLGTVPVLAAQPAVQWIVWPLVLVAAWNFFGQSAPRAGAVTQPPESHEPSGFALLQPALACMLVFPFFALSFSSDIPRPPPVGVMAREIDHKVSAIQLIRQDPGLEILWYEPQGDGRHHTLAVCMRYRGIHLDPSSEPGVLTDGKRWMREFFLQDGRLAPDYSTYLRRTFLPLTDPGAHVIIVSKDRSMTPASFMGATSQIAQQLSALAAP